MERLILVTLLGCFAPIAGAETQHNTTGIVTQAEYQRFVATHKIEQMPSESLITSENGVVIKREGSMLFVTLEASEAKLDLNIKKEKEHGR